MKQYPKYKESGIQWIGQVPEHWEVMAFKRVILHDMAGEVIDKNYWNQGEELLYTCQRTPMLSNFMGFPIEKRTGGNDLLLTRNATPYIFIPSKNAIYSNVVQRVILNNQVNKYFAQYWLSSTCHTMVAQGDTIPSYNMQMWYSMPFLFPPLSEQEAIAAYLDKQTGKIDKSIESLEQQKTDLQQYRTSLISEAVTRGLNPNTTLKDSGVQWIGQIPEEWGLTKLKYLTTKIGSGITPSGGATVYQDSGVLFVRSQNVHTDGLRLDDVAYISEDIDNKMQGSRVLFGDVLLNITGASIGRCTTFNLENTRANVNQHVCIVRPIQELVMSKYLQYVLNSKLGQTQIDLYQTGGNREGLNFEQLKNFLIPSIPLSEQEAIAAYLDEQTGKIDIAIATIDRQIADLRAYRTALITEAVTGKVDVRVSV